MRGNPRLGNEKREAQSIKENRAYGEESFEYSNRYMVD